MKLMKRASSAFLAAFFSLMAFSPPAFAGKDPQIETLENQIKFIEKTQLNPALKVPKSERDLALVASLRLQIEEIRAEIRAIRVSNKL